MVNRPAKNNKPDTANRGSFCPGTGDRKSIQAKNSHLRGAHWARGSRPQRTNGSDAVKRSKPAWKAVPCGSVAL
ncbi:hypothetical protein GCM10022233_57270 [Streptomyces shaanxiensis]|uniref:Uncharacterized protein n=1 Tax=Streptomyces shaanxiensis TaxID=653357 RepID=A0ABP7VR02_9ACTN